MADELPTLVADGRGDTPLVRLRWRCANCRGSLTNFVVTGDAKVRPW